MARGLSRDQSRDKNLKKAAGKGKGQSESNKGLTPAQVRERCVAARAPGTAEGLPICQCAGALGAPSRRRAAPEASASPLCCLAELRPSPRLALARVASTPITAIEGAVRSLGARSEAPRAAFLFAAARRGFGV